DTLVSGLRQAKYVDLLPEYNNVTYYEDGARLAEGGVEAGGKLLRSDRIVIATGARPSVPAIPGIETISLLDSTSALALTKLPRSMIVVGGGYVGAELAQMFARGGVVVTLVFRSHLLPESEPEIGQALAGYLADEGVEVISGAAYRSVARTDMGGVALMLVRDGRPETLTADRLLVATGRTPNTEGLGLRDMG